MEQISIKHYTADEYRFSEEPYEFLLSLSDFQRSTCLNIMAENAKKDCKITNFKTMFRDYCKEKKHKGTELSTNNNVTNFDEQPMELSCGSYKADDYGIMTFTDNGPITVCVHPIMPIRRLTNIDTLTEKLELAYRKGRKWKTIVVDKKTIASKTAIIALADLGIAVTSENGAYLVKYLHDIENYNYEQIPESNSVGRLGWIEGEGFAPYVDNLVFDGDGNFRTFFESVKEKGSYEKWLDLCKEIRKTSLYGRIVLAASFASALVKPLNCLPFFVHLWGGTEVGKTVGLMLATSVWANPEPGRFMHTFNSTAVGREKSAAFVNSMPLIMDELQIVSDKKQFDRDIYMLSEGAGKTRGNKTGGVDKTPTWANCIITSGEMPITTSSSGGGAVNRIVEIECKEKLFPDPRKVADTVRSNFGFAGRKFIEWAETDGNIEKAKDIFNSYRRDLEKSDVTEKQTMAISLVLTADRIITELFFRDDNSLKISEVTEFLKTRSEISANERALEYIYDYISINSLRFEQDIDDNKGEVWGVINNDYICIIRAIFNRICDEGGFNPQAVLSWLKQNKKIEFSKGFTKTKKIRGEPVSCVWLIKEKEEEEVGELDKDCPF